MSFISTEQARKNLQREIKTYDIETVKAEARKVWNEALGRIELTGGCDRDKTVFYTSMYRYYERQICMSEDGQYYSASDGKVHKDNGSPYYTDDWVWDTYRAAHPLRVLLEAEKERDIIRSFVTMAQQTDSLWLPTFPEREHWRLAPHELQPHRGCGGRRSEQGHHRFRCEYGIPRRP